MFESFNVIKEMVSVQRAACNHRVIDALEKLESHSAITSCDSYASFVLSNLPRASITRWLHAAR